MATKSRPETRISKVWLVLAVVIILFFVVVFMDRLIATAIPAYTGIFDALTP